jgi:predicted Zn-dependent protease
MLYYRLYEEWSVYLPLEVVAQPAAADISILRSRPPLQASLNRETGKLICLALVLPKPAMSFTFAQQ